jgi:hypothetical protein
MNNNYQIIILIIASDNTDYYINMQNVWKLYMNTHPHIKSFFIKENNNIDENIVVDDNIINVKCEPSLIPGILIKTIKSFEYVYNNYNFKYIYRTNLSSFLDLEKLYTFTTNNFDYAAVIGYYNNNRFGSGSGFFTSKESTKYLIDKKDIDYNKYFDDVVIGEILTPIYSIFPVGRIDFIDYDNKNISDNDIKKSEIFHYRCKNDENMHHTVYNLQKMYELLYKKV